VSPQSNSVNRVRRFSPAAITITAILFVVIPFLTWQQTWFGRRLSDAQIGDYLTDSRHPRKIQHALSQIADRIVQGDGTARKWIPQVAALADYPAVPVRATAAWVMGQDNTAAPYHQQLLKLLSDPDPMVRRNSALALVRFQDPSGRPELLGILHAYTFRATAPGRVSSGVQTRQRIGSGTVLARITPAAGDPVEVHSAFAGEVASVMVNNGEWVDRGQALVSVESGSDQVWEALRALSLIGRPEDVPVLESYAGRDASLSSPLKQQVLATADTIRARAERHPVR
jgi:hypothetical protein